MCTNKPRISIRHLKVHDCEISKQQELGKDSIRFQREKSGYLQRTGNQKVLHSLKQILKARKHWSKLANEYVSGIKTF